MTDVDICNAALQRIGQRVPIGSLNTATDTSENAELCSVAYPLARDALLQRFAWSFATTQAPLSLDANSDASAKGWLYRYDLPADFLEAQYIWAGIRPGQGIGANPAVDRLPQPLLPVINGAIPRVPFQVLSGVLYTDVFIPPQWSSLSTYAAADIVYNAGAYYTSNAAGNLNHAPAAGSSYWTATSPQPALVYTLRADPSVFSPLFSDALAWRLASDLALSLATKPALAEALAKRAELAVLQAGAADANGRAPDLRPKSAFTAVRG